jgi:hypothetical protein
MDSIISTYRKKEDRHINLIMSTLEDLPTELILEILELLGDEHALPNVILASKFFHRLATPILYRRIYLQLPQSCSWKDGIPINGLCLLRTLLENPNLGSITETLQIGTEGVIHREVLAMLQQQKLLVQWQGRLLTREREALERETLQLQEYLSFQSKLLKFPSSSRSSEKLPAQLQESLPSPSSFASEDASSKDHLRDFFSSDALKRPPAEDEAFRLYGMVDGSVSQAIALRKAEVTTALERNETTFRQNFGTVSTASIVAKKVVKPISESKRQSLKNDFLPVLTKALLPSWIFGNLKVDSKLELSEEVEAQKESLMENLRMFPPHTIQARVRLSLGTSSSLFQIFQEHADDTLFTLVNALLTFLPSIKKLNLNIPQNYSIPQPGLAPLPYRRNGQFLERLTAVTLVYSDGHINASHLAQFFELPSLKTIEVWGCYGFGPRDLKKFDYKNSSVTKLIFKGCMLASRWLQTIVRRCSDLQHLEYSHSFTEASHMTSIYPEALVLALREQHDNLISLRCDTPDDISGCGGDNNTICSFHVFTKLATLDVCAGVLLFHNTATNNGVETSGGHSSTEHKVTPIHQRLPLSLQTLILRHFHEEGTANIFKHLKDLLPRCKEFLPMLRKITLTSPNFEYLDHLTMLRAQFNARGILLVCEVCEPSRVSLSA